MFFFKIFKFLLIPLFFNFTIIKSGGNCFYFVESTLDKMIVATDKMDITDLTWKIV